jgi:cytosine/uracil/thiamine/allantoin permease
MGVESVFEKLEVDREGLNEEHSMLVNHDLLPVPPDKRTWTKWTCKRGYSCIWTEYTDAVSFLQTPSSGSVNASASHLGPSLLPALPMAW